MTRLRALRFESILLFAGLAFANPMLALTRPVHAQDTQPSLSGDEPKRAPAEPASQPTTALAVTRADLAAAYLRLEQAYFASPPTGEAAAKINQDFDQATLAFFKGRNADAIRAIDALAEFLGPKNRPVAERAVVSLKVAIEPPVWTIDAPTRAVARVASIYEWSAVEPVTLNLQLRVVAANGEAALVRPLTVTVGQGRKVDTQVMLDPSAERFKAGQYRIELAPVDGRGTVVGRVNVVAGESLDERRAANEKRLAGVEASSPQLVRSVASCRARNQLLNDRPSEVNSAQFLSDLNGLSHDVSAEIEMLASGKSPYSRRRDCWRLFHSGSRAIPLRVYAPQSTTNTPLPLLVVLHGMGGDENMFLEAYGAGVIKRIADDRGVLIASPSTYGFGSDIKTLHALLDALSDDYPIDRDRVYLLGHSLGAGAVAALARGHRDTLAAACCIAGGTSSVKADSPPVLVVSPDLDGVVPPKPLRESAEKAIAAGMPVEIRTMPGYGHTLAVGAILPEAVDWLLRHRRTAQIQ